tara:strand:- start:693 stop:1070 length:378 start_codon:yes stop_codon:yes gene_type:complete
MLFAYFIVISLTALVVGPAYASTSSGPAVDLRLVLTIGGMAASVVAASAVAKASIKNLQEQTMDFEKRLRSLDTRIDKLTTQIETLTQRVGVLVSMNDPSTMERRSREIERIRTEVDFIKKKVEQ